MSLKCNPIPIYIVSFLAPIELVFVATRREPPTEDNAGVWIVIFFA